jgi:hypothetical protein
LRVLAEIRVPQNDLVRQNVSLQLDFGIARKEIDLFKIRILHSFRPGIVRKVADSLGHKSLLVVKHSAHSRESYWEV